MKTTRFFVAALGLLVGLSAIDALAQTRPMTQPMAQPSAQTAPATSGRIGVIDISRIFKEHPRFINEMAQLKARVQAEDDKMKARANALQQAAEELKGFKSGSVEYKTKEKQIASDRAQMQIDIQVQRKEFLQQEAAIYKEIYEGVKIEVANFASRMGLMAVIRYTSQPPEDSDQPTMVLAEIQRDLVWFHPQLDITEPILNSLKARTGTPGGQPSVPYRAQGPTPTYQPRY